MPRVSLLLLFGPCAMSAMAALALFACWKSLAQVAHARLWSLAFALDALRWGLSAFVVDAGGAPSAAWLMPLQLLGLSTIALLAIGFCMRAHEHHFLRFGLTVWAGLAAGTILLHVVDAPAGAAAAFTSAGMTFALLCAARHAGIHSGPSSVAEKVALTMIVVQAIVCLAGVALGLSQALGRPLPLPPADVLLFAISPWSAATGLTAIFLIASDLWLDLNRRAHTDPLTGVLNRFGFEEEARRLMRRGGRLLGRRSLSIALGDIDRFKAINDREGHAAGDAALRAFAALVAEQARPDGIAGRIGGEEFAVLLPAHDAAAAFARVEAIRAAAARLAAAGAIPQPLTASFGVAERRAAESLAEMLARADRALYAAKAGGRDRTVRAEDPSD